MQEQHQSKSMCSPNYYLVSLFLTLMGTLLFLVNARGVSGIHGLLLISILLMVAPTLFYIFCEKFSLTRRQSLTLLLIPLFALQYIYYLQAGVPVGFTDPHYHIFAYWRLFSGAGKILFENVQQISFNLVGLYILFRLLSLACNLDIVTLAAAIPPFLNILIIIAVYLVVNRLHEHRIGLLAAMLYGWENQVLVFGQEFRTQTMGVIILFTITAFLLIINRKTVRSGLFTVVILLAGLVTISFVVNFYALLIFSGAVAVIFLLLFFKRNLNWLFLNFYSVGLYFLFIILIVFYLMCISNGFDNLITQFYQIFLKTQTKSQDPFVSNIIHKSGLLSLYGGASLIIFTCILAFLKRIFKWRTITSFCISAGTILVLFSFFLKHIDIMFSSVVSGVNKYLLNIMALMREQAVLYGNVYCKFVTFSTYFNWGLFLIPYIYYFSFVIKNKGKNVKPLIFFVAYSFLLAFCLVNRLTGPLSPSRPYIVVLILLVTTTSYFLYHLPGLLKYRYTDLVPKIMVILLVICFISGNVVKKPEYIIGNKYPFQMIPGAEDGVSYWHKDDGQYMASEFLSAAQPGRKVYVCMLMQRYPFLISTYENSLTPLSGIWVKAKNLGQQKGSLVLLEDKLYGGAFHSRQVLPKAEELDQTVQMMKIYTNDDYLLYEVKK